MEKIINTKIINNIATADEWETIKDTYVPLMGEMIIYSDLNNIKIGNGKMTVSELKFIFPTFPSESGDYLLHIDENRNPSWKKIEE